NASSELFSDAVAFGDWATREIAYALASKEDDCAFNGDGTSGFGGIVGLTNKFGTSFRSRIGAAAGHSAFSSIDNSDIGALTAEILSSAVAVAKFYCSQYFLVQVLVRLAGSSRAMSWQLINGKVVAFFMSWPAVATLKLPASGSVGAALALFGDFSMA